MYSPSSVWSVQEVVMSVCGAEGYSSATVAKQIGLQISKIKALQ